MWDYSKGSNRATTSTFLTDEQSWELLCKKVFPKNMANIKCSPGLEKLGREMLQKCGGLPLGIVVLGGLLATKKLQFSEWEVVSRNINTVMKTGQIGGVLGILSLSYNDLPYHLKPCFLYLGLFPEDFEIPIRKLIQWWIAEGFIPQQRGDILTMEDVGEEQYLAELSQRCMVQVSRRSLTGRTKTCRLHDLMRDMCLSKAGEENFLDVYPHHHKNIVSSSSHAATFTSYYKLRRHAIHKRKQAQYAPLVDLNSQLRTLVFVTKGIDVFYNVKLQNQYIKLLRVLDLDGIVFEISAREITEQIAKLIHLRFLRLKQMMGQSLSSSLGNLRYLQTLDLKQYEGRLPKTLGKMKQLRHLYLLRSNVPNSQNLRIENLTNLQTLKWIEGGRWIRKEGLLRLTNLRKLGLYFRFRSDVDEFLKSMVDKSSDPNPLRSLYLELYPTEKFPNMEPLSSCNNLFKLKLNGKFSENLRQYPPNLVKLTLVDAAFQLDPMEALQRLPNLKFLHMRASYKGKQMSCSADGFLQLRFLHIVDLAQLKEWKVQQGGMLNLKHLEVKGCKKLKMLPEGLKFASKLEQLEIKTMPSTFNARIARGGEDWYKVQHISSITFVD